MFPFKFNRRRPEAELLLPDLEFHCNKFRKITLPLVEL